MTENIKKKYGVESIIEPFTGMKSFEVIDHTEFLAWIVERFDHEQIGDVLDKALRDEWQTAYEEDLVEEEETNGDAE